MIASRLFGTLRSFLRIGPPAVEGVRTTNEGDGAIGFYREGPPLVFTNARAADPIIPDDLVTLRTLDATIEDAEFQLGWGADAATVEAGSPVTARILYPGSAPGEAADSNDLTKFPAIVAGTAGLVATELTISFTLDAPIGPSPGDDVAVYLWNVNAGTLHFGIILEDLPIGSYVFSSSIGGPTSFAPGDLVQVYVESLAATAPTTLLFLTVSARCRTL